MLNNPNVWIADSAAVVNTTAHKIGMHILKADNDSTTIGNGNNEKVQQITSITGMCCNKHGNELRLSKMLDVTHLPSGKFNLFSITKMQMNGWREFSWRQQEKMVDERQK
jgi:hypothetical protein